MTTANKYLELFCRSRRGAFTYSIEHAAENVALLSLYRGELKESSINSLEDDVSTVWFVDGSMIKFKVGSWAELGFYAQVQ